MDVNNSKLAIDVHNVNLSYGGACIRPSSKAKIVLNALSMSVPRGTIFGLLGPSGCGKTSLIRCVLGICSINSGDIAVFGRRPGTRGSAVPGPGVGYMPQDITLHLDLTIRETLHYFGALYGLASRDVPKRAAFLVEFLNLPDQNQIVEKLSGGQKRRVSLAVALIHKPPLLILDEPTVGVDPLLRQSIWEHLTELSRTDHLTVLITTHYIEEARDANLVGFMRDGRILEQDAPDKLLTRYSMNTLEQVFLYLCKSEESKGQQNAPQNVEVHERNPQSQPKTLPEELPTASRSSSLQSLGSIVGKNLRLLLRNPAYLVFQFLLPMIEIAFFCSALGRDIHSIPTAIYDGDGQNLSQSIIADLSREILTPTFYLTEQAALDSVKDGDASTAIIIPSGFEKALIARNVFQDKKSDIIYNSTIHLYPDMSNQMMVQFVEREMLRSFAEVGKQLAEKNGVETMDFPVQMNEPIYGRLNQPFIEYITPGTVLSIAYMGAISLTTMSLVVERRQGLLERTNVVGVNYGIILLSHSLTYSLVILIQVALLLIMILAIFKMPFYGSLLWISALTYLQAICGMCTGLFISAISNSENTATMLTMGMFYPNFLLSGTMWPVEAMHDYLRYFSYALPQTIPIRSLRIMMIRGWNMTRWNVLDGFVITLGWIALFLILSVLSFRFRK